MMKALKILQSPLLFLTSEIFLTLDVSWTELQPLLLCGNPQVAGFNIYIYIYFQFVRTK